MKQVLRKLWLLALFTTMSVTSAMADATVGTAAELKTAIEGLTDGNQTITLSAKITLTETITANQSFTLNLASYSITKGNYSIALADGVTVNTNKTISAFTTSADGKQVCIDRATSGYTYTVATAVAKKGSDYFTSFERAITYTINANGFSTLSYTVELLADVTMTSDVECILIGGSNAVSIKQGSYTLTPNGHKITLKRDIIGYTDKEVNGLFGVSAGATGCQLYTETSTVTAYPYRYRCLYKKEAKIGDTEYDTFAAAAEAATSEQVIVPMRSGIPAYNLPSGKTIRVKRVGCTVEGNQHSYSPSIKAPEGEYAISITSEKDGDGIYIDTYTVTEAAVIFTNTTGTTTTYYANMPSTLSSSGTYKLLKDATVSANITTAVLASDVTVDLNGHTLTNTKEASSSNYCFGLTRTNQKLTITDSSEGKTGKVVANNCIFVNKSGNELNIEAAIEVTGDFAVATNGSTTTSGTINIKEGAKLTSDVIAMYLPGKTEVNITGGTITAATGIYCKSGTLNISGGTITGTGAAADYVFNGNGANSTGDAVVIDNCGYPGGAPQPSITGGTFESANADPIASYVKQDDPTQTSATETPVENFVSGGTFNKELPADVIATDKICPSESNADGGKFQLTTGSYAALVGDYGYETFAKAAAAAAGTEVITLKANVDDAYTLAEDETLMVEKGNYTLTVSAAEGHNLGETTADGVTTYQNEDAFALTEEAGISSLVANENVGKKNFAVSLTRTFESGLEYGTVVFPFPVKVPASTVGTYHQFTGVDNSSWEVHMSAAITEGTMLEANKPYLFHPAASGENTFSGTIEEVASSYTPTADTQGDWSFEGTYEQITWDNASKFGNSTAVYAFVAGAVNTGDVVEVGKFQKLGTNGSVTPPFRAVMKYNGTSSSRGRNGLSGGNVIPETLTVVIDGADGSTTKIGTISVEANGGEWYTLDGRKLSGKPAQKGVYVNNGQKKVIR